MQFEIPLFVKTDKNGDEYYIGSTAMPALVDLSKVTFLVFHPEPANDRAVLVMRPRRERRPDNKTGG